MKLLVTGQQQTTDTINTTAIIPNTVNGRTPSTLFKGRSLALNQLVPISTETSSGIFTNNGDGTWTINGTVSETTLKVIVYNFQNSLTLNHTYYIGFNSGSGNVWLYDAYSSKFPATVNTNIWTYSSTSSRTDLTIRVGAGTYSNLVVTPQFIDLTQMFGAGLEPTTVNQIKSVIDLDKYIPYTPSSLISNNAVWEVNRFNQILNKNRLQSTSTSENITATNNGDGTFTVTGTATANSYTYMFASNSTPVTLDSTHKYIVPTNVDDTYFRITAIKSDSTTTYFRFNVIFTDCTALTQLWNYVSSGVSVNYTVPLMIIDLTDIFGSGHEPSTVTEAKARLNAMGINLDIYQPYTPIGSNLGGVSFNLWDGTCIDGQAIGNSGGTYASSSNFVTYYIAVRPSTLYYLNSTNWENWVGEYGSDRTWLRNQSTNDGAILTKNNCYYLRLTGKLSQKATACFNEYQSDTSISPHNGDYQPYKPQINKVDLGFNIWDEEWEAGGIASDGGMLSTTSVRSKNYTPVRPNTTYYITKSFMACYYQLDHTFIQRSSPIDQFFTTPANCYFIKLTSSSYYGNVYNHDVCLNLPQPDTTKSPHNGDYRPYLTLNGIGQEWNIWDEVWEVLYTNYVFSKNYIPVLPQTTYYFKDGSVSTHTLYYYDANKTAISNTNFAANNTFTTPANCYFMKFSYQGTTYNHNICINLSQPQTTLVPSNGTYLPHPIQDTYNSASGELVRNVGTVDLGSLSWIYNSDFQAFAAFVDGGKYTEGSVYGQNNCRCAKYVTNTATSVGNMSDKSIDFGNRFRGGTQPSVVVKDSSYTDATTFKAAMKGVMLYYELETPITSTTISQPVVFRAGNLGKVYGVVELSTLNWTRIDITTSQQVFSVAVENSLGMKKQSDNLFCSTYRTGHYNGTGSTIYAYGNKYITQHTPSAEFNLYVRDDMYTSISAFKNSLHGQYLIYELAQPVTGTPTYATAGNNMRFMSGDIMGTSVDVGYYELKNCKFISVDGHFLTIQ